ncbi:MAG: hypothetical protein WC665_01145 [Sulfurimonas sp.]|jgi:hypothetical protein
MDLNSIDDEIDDFDNLFFEDIGVILEEEMEFIEANNLIQPKDNFIFLLDYLNTLTNHFKNLDYTIMGGTFKKLHADVNFLYGIYLKKNKQSSDIDDIFQNKFFKKSLSYTLLSAEILKYENMPNTSVEEKEEYERLVKMFKDLQAVYFENFKIIFTEDRKYFLSSLRSIINIKTYYMDKFLWIEAANSKIIMSTLKDVKIPTNGHINSKNYIKHRLGIMMPYSKDYPYLQKCLKVYK